MRGPINPVNPVDPVDLDLHRGAGAAQRRTVRTLVLTQAVGAVGITIGIATASLLARDLSGSTALAGLAQTAQVLGAAVISFLLAPLMARRGRRVGLLTGYLTAAGGAALAVVAGAVGSLPLLLVGAVLLGAGTSANSAARYAATDLAEDDARGRALSLVVWATTIGAVAGPNLTGLSGDVADLLGVPRLTGPFVIGSLGLGLAAVVVGVLLRPDPLLLARQRRGGDAGAAAAQPERGSGASWRRARAALRQRPVLVSAIAGLALAHATMVAVMVMTPLHMEHGGAGLEVIGLVISVHVLGMFAFAPVVGWAADRWGRPRVLAGGGATLLVALLLCASSPEGASWQVSGGLFLLGLGWSLGMVASSTLVADHAPLDARPDVQGMSDLAMGVAGAGGGALAGVVVQVAGYPTLALACLALVVGVLASAAGAAAAIARDTPSTTGPVEQVFG